MKVLMVHPQMALYGGAEIVVVRLAHYLQKLGHKVNVLTLSTAPHSDYEGLDFILPTGEHIQYRLRGSLGALQDILGMYRALRELCAAHADDFDVINVHNFPAIWAVPSNKHIVWMCNEVPDLYHNRRVSGWLNTIFNACRLGDRLVTRSKHPIAVVADSGMAKIFRHRYGFLPNVIPYGIDGSFFARSLPSPDGFCALQPSMISPSKNQLAVLKAVRELKMPVIFAGYREDSNPYAVELDKYIAEGRIDATFTGHVSREELRSLYYKASVAVFPGRGQGSWLGPFEALAAGVPIIVSPNLSCSAMIAEQRIGTVTDDMTGVLRAMRDGYPKYQQQALRGREFVLSSLTWDKFGEKIVELLYQCI